MQTSLYVNYAEFTHIKFEFEAPQRADAKTCSKLAAIKEPWSTMLVNTTAANSETSSTNSSSRGSLRLEVEPVEYRTICSARCCKQTG